MTDKEKYNQIIDETYGNYISYIHDIVQGEHQIYGNWYGKKEFTNKCKTDPEFSESWGLKIEEREVLKQVDQTNPVLNGSTTLYPHKLITLTYNNETIEVYE